MIGRAASTMLREEELEFEGEGPEMEFEVEGPPEYEYGPPAWS